LGPAVESVFSGCARVLTRPESNLADHLALAAALMATVMFGLTGILLALAFSRGTYFGGIGTNVLQTTSTPLRFGGNTYPKDYFQGLIDNVRIYNRPLTTSEIQADIHLPVPASGPTPSPAAALVAAYSFDEGMGTTVGPTPQARATSALFLPQPGRRQTNSGTRWPSMASRMW
jgi:Concanavalin A-like lectin/glucanases superfamily